MRGDPGPEGLLPPPTKTNRTPALGLIPQLGPLIQMVKWK